MSWEIEVIHIVGDTVRLIKKQAVADKYLRQIINAIIEYQNYTTLHLFKVKTLMDEQKAELLLKAFDKYTLEELEQKLKITIK